MHVARYRWVSKESAVVTNAPDAGGLEKPRRLPPALGKGDPRAFGQERPAQERPAQEKRSTWGESLRTAWTQSVVVVRRTGEKATDLEFTRGFAGGLAQAHARIARQVHLQHERARKALQGLWEKRG